MSWSRIKVTLLLYYHLLIANCHKVNLIKLTIMSFNTKYQKSNLTDEI